MARSLGHPLIGQAGPAPPTASLPFACRPSLLANLLSPTPSRLTRWASPPLHTMQELAATAPGFVNASVEFDVASLRPTYRLLWGAAGESNALAVAQGLGFAPAVVAAAREVGREPTVVGAQRRCFQLGSLMGAHCNPALAWNWS